MTEEQMFEVKFKGTDLVKATSEKEAQEDTIKRFNDLGFPMALLQVLEVKPYKS